ncbi:MAG: TIGR03620 family F420-dependent LLM class oxidoreductase [Propionibacteriaceae bacterium]
MTKIDLGPIGIGLTLTDDGSHLAEAMELEHLGYSTVWLSGGQLQALDPVAEIIRATDRIQVGTGIIPLDVHDDRAVTRAYADLERTDPGRFVVGLGAPQQGRSPMGAMDAFLDRVEAADPPIPQQRRILAALGPRKLAMARDRFAGAVTLLVTPAYTAAARKVLGPDRTLVVDQFMVLDTDADRAREAAREPLSFLLQVPGYQKNTLRLGFTQAEIDDLDDRLVDTLVNWGDAETLAARVAEHRAAGADHVVVNLPATSGSGSFLDNAAAVAHQVISAASR